MYQDRKSSMILRTEKLKLRKQASKIANESLLLFLHGELNWAGNLIKTKYNIVMNNESEKLVIDSRGSRWIALLEYDQECSIRIEIPAEVFN